MRNPILVFLASIDHHSSFLSSLFKKLRIYDLMEPHVFEYYCVFCRRYCDCWWEDYWRTDEERVSRNEELGLKIEMVKCEHIGTLKPEEFNCIECEDNAKNCNCIDCMGVFCPKCRDIIPNDCDEIRREYRKKGK